MLRLGTFEVDCTPPVGIEAAFSGRMESVRDPLMLRGFVLEEGHERCLVASLDYLALLNTAQDDLVAALAGAIGVHPTRVVVQCIQQHDAPFLDFEADDLLGRPGLARDWWQGVAARCAEAAEACTGRLCEVAAVGHGETRLRGYASNRRILGPDGRVRAVRWSRCADPETRDAPAGTIDPMLRTVAFRAPDGSLLGTMSFYATHPQVSNGRHRYSADAPGEAMRLVSRQFPGGVHAFFTGPGGNVTAGKYTSPDDLEGNLLEFGRRLADGISLNLAAVRWETAGAIRWQHATFPFPRRVSEEEALSVVQDPQAGSGDRLRCAVLLSCLRHPGNREYPMALLRLPGARLLFLAGEPFVEYQLFVQSLVPDEFIAVADNCSDNFLYLPLARSFEEGGYEPTYSWCSEAFEGRFKEAAAALLAA